MVHQIVRRSRLTREDDFAPVRAPAHCGVGVVEDWTAAPHRFSARTEMSAA
jgi:hypothetical protein